MRTILALLAATLTATAVASDDTRHASEEPQETVRIWTVDNSGKPPHRRTVEELPVTDMAAMEASEADSGEPDREHRGRPPFNRNR